MGIQHPNLPAYIAARLRGQNCVTDHYCGVSAVPSKEGDNSELALGPRLPLSFP